MRTCISTDARRHGTAETRQSDLCPVDAAETVDQFSSDDEALEEEEGETGEAEEPEEEHGHDAQGGVLEGRDQFNLVPLFYTYEHSFPVAFLYSNFYSFMIFVSVLKLPTKTCW